MTRVARALAALAAAGPIAAYAFVALRRLAYPFELEWLEGGMLDHVRRVLEGQGLYPAPSLDFVAYIYPPLYYYAAALAAKVLGVSFLPLRLVSFLASVGCLVLIADLVRRETGRAFAGLLAAGLFAATFRASGFWFDLGRVDSLFLLLLLGTIHLARFGRSTTAWVLTAVCVSLAFLTKPSALVLALALGAHEMLRARRRAAVFLLVALGLMGGATLTLDRLHDGWYAYYAFRPHPIVRGPILRFFVSDLAGGLPVAVLAAGAYFASAVGDGGLAARRFHAFALGGLVAISFLGRLIVGGYLNALIPAHAALAILFGLAVHEALERVHTLPLGGRVRLEPLVYAACLVQFAALAYDPTAQVPTAADRAAGERLVRTLSGVDGEVLVPFHPYLLYLAGKRPHAHYMAVDEILQFETGPERERLAADIRTALGERRFAAVVLDKAFSFEADVKANYRLAGRLFEDPDVFQPLTGAPLRPEALYLPAEAPPAP